MAFFSEIAQAKVEQRLSGAADSGKVIMDPSPARGHVCHVPWARRSPFSLKSLLEGPAAVDSLDTPKGPQLPLTDDRMFALLLTKGGQARRARGHERGLALGVAVVDGTRL